MQMPEAGGGEAGGGLGEVDGSGGLGDWTRGEKGGRGGHRLGTCGGTGGCPGGGETTEACWVSASRARRPPMTWLYSKKVIGVNGGRGDGGSSGGAGDGETSGTCGG
jgi:hypothetical protein